MAVPKKKTSKGRTTRRFKSHANKVQKKLVNRVQLVECPDCKQQKRNHFACPHCGKYRGRDVLDMGKEMEKITKIQA